ncbi:hypothetical protein MML48_8g00020480 [Holotrichia oblita]|uniref:Uncharacterized protein n=1 Tax=Holotrichia oblita TaxID=644536 RepID=A0ACB9SQT5_HOLOL|nr:hypothetical protein MML48_8g00020480 [Holotrichia oblita]
MVTRVRNRGCFPYVSTEGQITKPLPTAAHKKAKKENGVWHDDLTVFERLYSYHTLASVRRYAHFKPFTTLIPQDDLDFVLASSYNHNKDVFPDKVDVMLQDETIGVDTWRRLRNTRDIKPEKDAISAAAAAAFGSAVAPISSEGKDKEGKVKVGKYNEDHPLYIGGVAEKRHPSNVKLMNSSHHSPQTNAGYSRQDSDGNVYQY